MSTVRKNNEKSSLIILGTPYKEGNKHDIRIHVSSLFRFTYRKDFPTLHPYPISSDAGWGCMLRSAQMLMACALQRHLLGPDWRKSENINILRASDHYCNILRWFSDFPGPPHVYSIHHLVQCGMRYDKLPGEWFGPSTAALVLRDLTKLHRSKYGGPLEVLVTQGDTIYIRDCENLCASNANTATKDTVDSVNVNNKVDSHTEGNDINSNTGFNGRSTTNTIGRVPLNCISEDDTMFSNCTETICTTAAADFVSSSSSVPETDQPASVVDDKSNTAYYGKAPVITVPEKGPHLVKHSEAIIKCSQPLFDPLLNPPPSYTAPWECSLVVCIPLRLGISSVSSEYIEELKELLRNPNCIGFVGGRVNHAIYFVGYKTASNGGTELLGLDPHSVYPANREDPFPSPDLVSQVHVQELDALDSSRLDPSLALALYFRNRQEFELFCDETRANVERKRLAGITPLFCVEHSAPSYGSHGWSGDDHGEEEGGEGCEEDEYILV